MKTSKIYLVEGTFKMGMTWQHFKKNVDSDSEKNAREKVYSLLGSEHRLKRNQIKINSAKEEKGE